MSGRKAFTVRAIVGMCRTQAGSNFRSLSRGMERIAAGEFQSCQAAFGCQWPGSVPGAHTKEGQVATAGEILEVARRVGNAVDFVE